MPPVTEEQFQHFTGRLDALILMVSNSAGDMKEIGANVKALLGSTADHEKRIRTVERFMWKAIGSAIGAGAAAGGLAAEITRKLGS